TPPTIQIVSPKDGDRVAIGSPLDIILKSFDRYGVDRVEVRINGGAFETANQPTRFRYTPLGTDPLTIEARAIDSSGFVSTIAAVTVQPFDATLGEPSLDLIAPANGSQFHEGETVNFEVALRVIDTAQLFLDVGGQENDPRNPPPLTINRAAGEAQQFQVSAKLPVIGENAVIVARLVHGGLRDRLFLNVLQDNGIAEDPVLSLLPANEILGGTDLWLDANAPPAMDDADDDSNVQIFDPADGAQSDEFSFAQGPAALAINNSGSGVRVAAVLRDRSGNARTLTRNLNKISYFDDATTGVFAPTDSNEMLDHYTLVPQSDNRGNDVYLGINNRNGGYRIQIAGGATLTESAGRLDYLEFTGTGLLAVTEENGLQKLLFRSLRDGTLAATAELKLSGDMIGANGDTIYMRYGQVLAAYLHQDGQFIAIAGRQVNEPLEAIFVDGHSLYALSETGLYRFSVGGAELPQLQQDFYVALPHFTGLRVDGERLTVWNDQTARFFRLQDDGSLIEQAQVNLGGPVKASLVDGELVWLLADGPFADNTWQAYREGELIALRSGSIESMLFDGAVVYEKSNGGLQRRELAAQPVTTDFLPSITETPLGVLIGAIAEAETIGGDSIRVENSDGSIVPMEKLWLNGVEQRFVPRSALNGGLLRILRTDRSGHTDQIELTVNATTFTAVDGIYPQNNADVTRGARMPVRVALASNTRIENQYILAATQSLNLSMGVGIAAYQWLDIPAQGTFGFEHRVDNVTASTIALVPVVNQPELDQITILAPANNQSLNEDQPLRLKYRTTDDQNGEFRYVEIRVMDFNHNILNRYAIAEREAELTVRLPEVAEQANLIVEFRAYYGTGYRYSSDVRNVRVFPKLTIPAVKLSGLTSHMMVGSTLQLAHALDLVANLTAQIELRDNNGVLLAAGERNLDYRIPLNTTATAIAVSAVISDAFGNERDFKHEIRIIDPFRINDTGTTLKFSVALPDVAGTWVGSQRRLLNRNGEVLTTLDANITALSHLGNRLLLALQGIGLVVIDPADTLQPFRELSRFPLSGNITALMALGDDRALAIVDGKVLKLEIAGNAVESKGQLAVDGNARGLYLQGAHFIVQTDTELARINTDFSVNARIGRRFSAISRHDDYLYAVNAANNRLHLIRTDFKEQILNLDVPADKLFSLQGDLLAVSEARQLLQVIDVRDPVTPRLIGRFAYDVGSGLGNAIISGGRLYLGGSKGTVYQLVRSNAAAVLGFATERPRGIFGDVTVSDGRYLAAAEFYGAVNHRLNAAGKWEATVIPAAYQEATQKVASLGEQDYLLQMNSNRVVRLLSATEQQSVLDGRPFEHLVVTNEKVVASVGATLYMSLRGNREVRGNLLIGSGDPIVGLAAAAEMLYVATSNGILYQVETGGLPLVDADVQIRTLINAAEPARLLAANGDYVFYVVGDVLHRLRLLDLQDEALLLAGDPSALTYSAGRLWLGIGNTIYTVDAANWTLLPGQIVASSNVSGLAVEYNRLLVGLSGAGVRIYDLPYATMGADPSLATPVAKTVYVQGGRIDLSLLDGSGVRAVRYRINNQLVAVSTQAPFSVSLPVPPDLRNGQPFDISLQVETVWGEAFSSQARRVLLQGEGLPGNPFRVVL
ncbi:MAG TPA: Ig-like domain-containing protein, partial [Gammaproteobacteria bacterium]